MRDKILENRKRLLIFLFFVIMVIFGFGLIFILRDRGAKDTDIEADKKGEIADGWKFDGKLDPNVQKLSEINMDFLWNYEIILYDNSYPHNGQYVVEDPEIVERVITNLDSLYIKECDPTPYVEEGTRGLEVGAYSKDASRFSCSIEILGKNENGNYVLSLATYNEETAEIVEGELDYEYLKSLYVDEVKKNGGTLEEEVTE